MIRPFLLWSGLRGAVLGLALVLVQAGDVGAQGTKVATPPSSTPLTTAGMEGPKVDASQPANLDYAAWEKLASRVEEALTLPETTSASLDIMRAQLVDWRQALQLAQSANATRIATLRQQIAALGAVPKEGETEAPEIAQRRQELTDQLVRLQAPGIAAEEAYSRADGLIREIDRTQRDRQAHELLQLWPAPINPANWAAGFEALSETALAIGRETAERAARKDVHSATLDNLPLIVVLTFVGVGLIWRGRSLVNRVIRQVQARLSARAGWIAEFLISIGEIILPTVGMVLLTLAVTRTTVLGTLGGALLEALPGVTFIVSVSVWLGGRLFPAVAILPVPVPEERRAEGRFLATSFGLVLGFESLRGVAVGQMAISEAGMAVLAFPVIAVSGLLLVRIGHLLRRRAKMSVTEDERASYFERLIGILGRAATVVGVVAPLLAAVGYVAAAQAIVLPAAVTLALVGLLAVLQRLVGNVYALVTGNDETGQEALVPVLVGFAMTLSSLPIFALIWGARWSDLTELWNKFQEGFQLGETKVSPTDFLYFAIVFGICFTLTRLLQGALRGSILPRTALDQGGQNAVVSGVGYIGVFLSGLAAINTVGIDLSGLTLVAGALSVGIGFGLQAIVGNFVSGIILLVERPVSEGDWIEVGGVQGTVKSISVRSTRIQTFDRTDVIVPNQDLVTGRVTNWTRFNLSGRLIVPVNVAFGSDTRQVERLLSEIAEAQPLVMLNPPPVIAFMGFGADAMMFEIRVILRDVNFSLSVRSEINHAIVERFREAGIQIPFAQREVTVRNLGALAEELRPKTAPHALPFRDEVPGRGEGPLRDDLDDADSPDPDQPESPEAR